MQIDYETVDTIDDGRAAWLAERRTGIGASESAAILGISPYATPYSIWALKTGRCPEPTGERLRAGLALEPYLRERYTADTGRACCHIPYDLHRHPAEPWLLATLDGTTVDDDGNQIVVELKTTEDRDAWYDGVPDHVRVQVQHQMLVTGIDRADVVVAIGLHTVRVHRIDADHKFQRGMLARLKTFWRHVLDDTPPPIDASPITAAALTRSRVDAELPPVTLPEESASWDAELTRIKAEIKALEEHKVALENRIKSAIGDAPAGLLPGGGRYTFGQQTRSETTIPASTFRVLRRSNK